MCRTIMHVCYILVTDRRRLWSYLFMLLWPPDRLFLVWGANILRCHLTIQLLHLSALDPSVGRSDRAYLGEIMSLNHCAVRDGNAPRRKIRLWPLHISRKGLPLGVAKNDSAETTHIGSSLISASNEASSTK